ncbi:MAG: hypothetical protein IJ053_02130 [Lachnospiraceae bacterium]|nr:hypothetical protein [Lachnospiraceae bacterium]
MRYGDFLSWLQEERGMSERSARDVVSRSKRTLIITGQNAVDSKSIDLLMNSGDFIEFSPYIKSQLKRAITLYMEFLEMC